METEFLYGYYHQDGNNSAVTGGIGTEKLSVNEPDITVGYESCDWNGSQMKRFMRDYAPSVNYPVFCPESFQFIKTISDSVLN